MATIKKGSYRWNDNVTIPDFEISAEFDFTLPNTLIFDLSIPSIALSNNTENLYGIKAGSDDTGKLISYYYDDGSHFWRFVNYPDLYGWDTIYEYSKMVGAENQELKGYGQTITVTEDFIPSNADEEAFATWFLANIEGGAEATPAVEITYKGEKIELSAGDVATLHIKDHKLTEDLVIKANASGGSYEEYNGEVVIE